jgi:hypothetical protein
MALFTHIRRLCLFHPQVRYFSAEAHKNKHFTPDYQRAKPSFFENCLLARTVRLRAGTPSDHAAVTPSIYPWHDVPKALYVEALYLLAWPLFPRRRQDSYVPQTTEAWFCMKETWATAIILVRSSSQDAQINCEDG